MKDIGYTKLFIFFLIVTFQCSYTQNLIQHYDPAKRDSLRIGPEKNDQLAFIQAGYTLMTPKSGTIDGVLIFLEDSGFDDRNSNAKSMYQEATNHSFAVLSVSTELPFDFYFTTSSLETAQNIIQSVFKEHQLPNKNIFFLGASLTGHRALRYLKFIMDSKKEFTPNAQGLVLCNFTMDWTRKWRQHERDIKINRIDLWEPKFINYMLETYLKGTPQTRPKAYHEFSAYSYFDPDNSNIEVYKNYSIRAYVEPAINYRLKTYYRTLYDNNTPDMVGFISELKLVGNDQTELFVIAPQIREEKDQKPPKTWDRIDKEELMNWILIHSIK